MRACVLVLNSPSLDAHLCKLACRHVSFRPTCSSHLSRHFSKQGQVTLDFVCIAAVQSLEVVWEAAFPKRYDVEMSVDSHTWRTVVDSAVGREGHVVHDMGNKRAQFIRLTCQEGWSYWGCSMFELKAKGHLQQGCHRVALDPKVTRAMNRSKLTLCT